MKDALNSLFFHFLAILFLIVWCINDYSADVGIPKWLENRILKKLDDCGYSVKTEISRFSLTDGLELRNLSVLERKGGIRLAAPLMKIDFEPLDLFDGTFFPIRFHVKDGEADLPLLPESGEEGKSDVLQFRELNAEIKGAPGELRVRQSSAKIGNFTVNLEGTIDNFLHVSLGNMLSDYFRGGKKNSTSEGVIQTFPLEIRKKVMRAYLYCSSLNMNGDPRCNLKFHFDLMDFFRCRISADLEIPEFQYNGITIRKAKERLSLQDGELRLEQMQVMFGEGSVITAEGNYNETGKNFTGGVKGSCRIGDLLGLADEQTRRGIERHIVLRSEKLTFDGILEHFSLSDSRYNGNIRMEIPEIVIDGILIKNIILSLFAEDGRVFGEFIRAELENDGSFTGSFNIERSGGILCRIKGNAHPSILWNEFPEEVKTYIRKNVSSSKEDTIDFSGYFASDGWDQQNCSGCFKIKCPHVKVSGVELLDISTEIDFTQDTFFCRDLKVRSGDGSKIEGTLVCDLRKDYLRARGICSGNPGKLSATLDNLWKMNSLSSLAKDISCSDPNGVVEADMELFADYGKKPFYRISGGVVMKKPIYCGVPFRYGAVRFITDSDDFLVLPDVILESENGTLWLEAIYIADPENPDGGTAHLNMNSSIPGNDLLKIMYPEWKPLLLDFCDPISISSRGIIDYSDESKSKLKILVQNGSCLLAGIKATNIDAVLDYDKQILTSRNAGGTLCGGVFHGDLVYDLEKETGSLKEKIENADLTTVLKEFGISEFAPKGTGDGKLSFESTTDFAWKGEILKMNGTGKLDLNGDELWDIPVLSSFLKYIGSAWPIIGESTGITRLTCDITFSDEKAEISSVKSNGKLLSLDANGNFLWNTGDYDLTFRAELLKNALPFEAMSKILTPVSWILRKSYKGKYIIPKNNQ